MTASPFLIGSLAMDDDFEPRSGLVAGAAAPVQVAGPIWGTETAGVSVRPGGGALAGGGAAAISADGRYVAFGSSSSKLVPGDTNSVRDVFVRDRVAEVTVRVSVGPGGRQANRRSMNFDAPTISANGRFVAFTSTASNLVARDTNRKDDVFVRDLKAKVTRRVSLGPGSRQANGPSFEPAISANGQRVVFSSTASNLAVGDSNGRADVFIRYRVGKLTRLASIGRVGRNANGHSFSPAISADGRWVAFLSVATNLVRRDTNQLNDVFVWGGRANVTRRVSVGPGGRQANNGSVGGPTLSAHGRYVAFPSYASNLVSGSTRAESNVFVRDRAKRVTQLVSVGPRGRQANDASFFRPSISASGRYVAFDSFATNLVSGDSGFGLDVFVRDRIMKRTKKVSIGLDGAAPNDESAGPVISADGRHVAFMSIASNLVDGDTNNKEDVFVRD